MSDIDVYKELCNSYRAIDEFRAKILGFLPLATGTGIFIILGNKEKIDSISSYLGPIGVFGFIVTLALFFYELHGIKKCDQLIEVGKYIEDKLGIIGQFKYRPSNVIRVVNEPFTACIIYSVVLGAWAYISSICWLKGYEWVVGLVTFCCFFIVSFLF